MSVEKMESNIILHESKDFGNPNYEIVRNILNKIDNNMMSALGLSAFSSKCCDVFYTDKDPLCKQGNNGHNIYLCVKNDDYYQWIFQFSHEYCHHLINGTMSGVWSDMLWFEETICQIASLYNMFKMVDFCKENWIEHYDSILNERLHYYLEKANNDYKLNEKGGWFKSFAGQLRSERYKRDLYNSIAVLMYPLFIENPNLWKIILYIGDIRSWNSLDELFKHLQSKADTTYVDSLKKMIDIFS